MGFHDSPRFDQSSHYRHWLALSLVCAIAALVYEHTLKNGFVYDDHVLIVENDLFHRMESLPQLFVSHWWKGMEQYSGMVQSDDDSVDGGDKRYRPLVGVTYVLNYALGRLNPLGYHLVNVLFHAGVSCLLYLVALRLRLSESAALLAALLFAVHPLHVEAVAWVVARPELLMSASILGGLWFVTKERHALALAAFAWGLFSKEQAVMLPVIILLYDVCIGGVFHGQTTCLGYLHIAARRYWGYVLVIAGYAVARFIVLGGINPQPYPFLENPLEHLSGAEWMFSTVKMAGLYLWLVIWPAGLSVDYSYNSVPIASTLLEPGVLWGIAAWGGLVIAAIWAFPRDARVSFSIGFTVLTFAPVSNFLISVGTPLAERLFYLPLAGLCLLVGVGWDRLPGLGRSTTGSSPPSIHPRWVWGVSVAGGVVFALSLRTIERGHDWLNDINLFQSAISIHPSNAKAYALLGDQYMKLQTNEGREQALAQYETAMQLYPDYATTHAGFASNLGKTLFELGRTHEAIDALQQGISANPRWSLLHYNLALMYAKSGQYTRADQAWRQALALNPDDPQVGSTYSRFLIERGLYEEGLSQAQMILQRHPDFVLAVYNRALALQSLGRVREAIEGYERVLALPNSPDEAKADVMRKLQSLRSQLGPGSSSGPPCPLGLTAC